MQMAAAVVAQLVRARSFRCLIGLPAAFVVTRLH
jgi:hypothetical protein